MSDAKLKRERILEAVRSIPKGKVATYGQIARVAGLPGRARLVGKTLRELPEGSRVPWHRVLNACGEISSRGDEEGEDLQRLKLKRERVPCDSKGRVDLKRFRWGKGSNEEEESFRRFAGV